MYQNTTIIIRKDRINGNTPIENVPYHPYSLIFTLTVIKDWLQVIKLNMLAKDLILNTILFADDRVIVASMKMNCKEQHIH
jgi:hypothetical protein